MSKANQHPLDVYPLPEPRQLVKMLRQQRGVCNRTDSCICCEIPAQHQAELSFIAEDNLGEPRNVVLEIKPGVPIVKNAGLPIVIHFGLELEARHKRHYDSPIQFDAFLDAVRGGGSSRTSIRRIFANCAENAAFTSTRGRHCQGHHVDGLGEKWRWIAAKSS